ncbi:bifunctional glutamate N-acetyltransferase/amino-acid acetyltransferase ArgJ [Thermogemmatispora sp.]|uniref:bifunctional glutamate N-acetyltransferase/amino-acid acetyltransferase ArgJ n=1 Tax=Thermogemmatispora sp. TaxID=1968838 RepID=UPI001DCDE16D|nr:bifunctional glutamate N-acetyltransferase/amino-acid acetyltransferase ArgJ [Thermogemmatispora sp.]MBX5450455.1 bifunctional glutamate N-acetyltransferase/amino-acid acetyltransferase ArgJ [Thermogemmatispora sp.]
MTEQFREVDLCVTAPRGFRAGAVACGIKSDAAIKDLAILASDVPCVAAGTFTTSRTPAAPVLLCREYLRSGKAQAVVVNSGNANCATGEQGLRNAYRMSELAAAHLGIPKELVLCSSTGIIGRQLPMEKIEQGIAAVELSSGGGNDFAEAILTTDTRPKRIALEFEIEGRTVRLGGATKGAGMIYPNMATMLCYLTTDAAVEQLWLQEELQAAVAESFNMISVDGDMSTNDTCLLFANGLAGNTPLNKAHPEAPRFREALRRVTTYLAREIARDGEGATKLMTVHVRGARDRTDAIKAARGITLSPLWQCALAGGDPNWGRIVAALGACGCTLDPNRFDIFIGPVQVVQQGGAASYDEAAARAAMAASEVLITIDLHLGEAEATAWGCDLTHGYIDENTLYTR